MMIAGYLELKPTLTTTLTNARYTLARCRLAAAFEGPATIGFGLRSPECDSLPLVTLMV